MIIGPAGCGKSTLAQALEECEKAVRKTPEVLYGERTIDCPGAYVENRGMYHHLIALAQDASQLVLVMDAARPADVYSHNFAGAFSKPGLQNCFFQEGQSRYIRKAAYL